MTLFRNLENSVALSPWALSARLTAVEKGRPGGGGVVARSIEELFRGVETLQLRGETQLVPTCIITDSRRVVPGAIFVALPGLTTDGNLFVEEAVDRGAVAVVSEKDCPSVKQVTFVHVEDARKTLAVISRRFYHAPDEDLELFGITGTNGKTTVSTLARFLLEERPASVGLLGTVNYVLGKRTLPAFKTTPESVDIYSMLEQMHNAGCRSAVMEVSSHAIDQLRVQGLRLRHTAFLNLTQDHIDYHRTMEAYFGVKRRLFTGELGNIPETASINIDDPYGSQLADEVPEGVRLITFGERENAQIRAVNVDLGPEGSTFDVVWPGGRVPVRTGLPGRYNVSNVLAALALCHASGRDIGPLAEKVSRFPGVPGRMEKVDAGQPFQVLVDYAHTDDALQNVLLNLRPIVRGRLLVVFGCGGNRDRAKRPKMVQAVQRWADFTWATADNPRRESLGQIFDDMRTGVSRAESIVFIEERRRAISLALDEARDGDCVVIAGKGHETFQEFASTVVPFDDRAVARELLELKKFRGGV